MNSNKTLLIIGIVWPEPKSSAAGGRMLQLIEIFKELDYRIVFASASQESEFSFPLKDIEVGKENIFLNDDSFDDFVSQLNPYIVLFDRFMIEEQFGWRVSKSCPNALKILDTEDLHSLRLGRQKAFKEEREFDASDLFSDVAKREIASILRCDVSLMVSEFEINLLKEQFKIDESLLLYLPIFIKKSENQNDFHNRKNFAFIGNFLHEPNWNSVLYLKETIWTLIHKQLPEVNLRIYGAYPSQKVLQLHSPKANFFIEGRAENASKVISEARIMLAPLRFGAGIKGKLLEGMQYGTPSITTSIGAESMHDELPWNGFIEDNPQEFANKAVQLYNDEKLWNNCQENGFEIIKYKFSKDLYFSKFKEKINYLLNNLSIHRNNHFIGQILQHHTLRSTEYMSRWIEAKNKIS
ncbi:glycosyltransferase [Flavobacterium qiangtangense]|uniref:Glycosyltransferase n=1 Tax=Flavobacterium qiangtangense TaxID=1442595 RepID=A0ABW1PNQ6_9FLAO